MRTPPEGTVARGQLREDDVYFRGKTDDGTFVESIPFRETRNYVPAFMAATIISKEPEKYGFSEEYEPVLEYERVEVDETTDLDVIARCAGTDVATIKELNPELRRWCTPPGQKSYRVAVPRGSAETFAERYAAVPRDKKVNWRRYHVARGDTLSTIAQRYGTSVTAIMDVNNLRSRSLIRAGSYLLIPVPGGGTPLPPRETEKVASRLREQRSTSALKGPVQYRVRRGDTLWGIARRYGTSVESIQLWNPSLKGSAIHPGDLLNINPSGPGKDAPPEDFTYLVKRGDTLWEIARRFKADLSAIKKVNGIGSAHRIYPGDRLTIPGYKSL